MAAPCAMGKKICENLGFLTESNVQQCCTLAGCSLCVLCVYASYRGGGGGLAVGQSSFTLLNFQLLRYFSHQSTDKIEPVYHFYLRCLVLSLVDSGDWVELNYLLSSQHWLYYEKTSACVAIIIRWKVVLFLSFITTYSPLKTVVLIRYWMPPQV